MKFLYAQKGERIIVDDSDFDQLKDIKWYVYEKGYVVGNISGKTVKMHRLIMGFPELTVDHKNRDKLDNRRENLRICTIGQNKMNVVYKKQSRTGFRGVYESHLKNGEISYRVCLKAYGKRIHVGTYKTKEIAYEFYKKAARKYQGEFSVV